MSTLRTGAELPYWDQFRETAIGRSLLAREVGFVRRVLEEFDAPTRVLELCSCGGRVSLSLRDEISDLIALDIDQRALRVFRDRSRGCPAVAADAALLPFRPGSFDCIIAIQCLRYFDARTLFRQCNELLHPRGALVFQAVNRRGYKRRLKEAVRPERRGRHTGTAGTDDVLRWVVDAGFEVRGVEGYNWLPFPADTARWSDTFLVELTARLEPKLGLGRRLELSPWLLIDARKPDRDEQHPVAGPGGPPSCVG